MSRARTAVLKSGSMARRTALGIIIPACSVAACGQDTDGQRRGVSLEYQLERHFPGVDETVLLVKDPFNSYVIRPGGERIGMSAFLRLERTMRREKFGAIDPRFWAQLQSAAPDVEFEVIVQVDGGHMERVPAQDAVARHEVRARYVSELPSHTQQIVDRARDLGADGVRASRRVPLVFARAKRDVLVALARDAEIVRIVSAAPGVAVEHASQTHPDDLLDILGFQSTTGYHAETVKIGGIDPGSACRVRDEHAVFSNTAVSYQSGSFTGCSTNTQCNDACGRGVCVSGECVDSHATEVFSVVAQVLPYAPLFFATDGGSSIAEPDPSVACSASAIEAAYDWMESNGVRVVNESYECRENGGHSSVDGFVQDLYARSADLVIVKSAGNKNVLGENEPACPHSLNSVCVGSVTSAMEQACASNWRNPGWYDNWTSLTDREEPDVMAFGGDGETYGCSSPPPASDTVRLANPNSTSGYVGRAGTSYAAPAITALSALLIDACEGESRPINGLMVRALLRTGAYRANPSDWRYSTLKVDYDWVDGAGFVDGAVLGWCMNGGGPWVGGIGTIDTDEGDPLPSGEWVMPTTPPGGTASLGPGKHAMNQSWEPADGGRKAQILHTFDDLRQGDKLRATFSWYGCAEGVSSAPGAVSTDFDLLLYNDTTHEYVYGSQTWDDNNEGFDVTVPSAGDYQLLATWPEGSEDCTPNTFDQPYAYAAIVLAP